jgi:hypothetical protein
VIYQPTDVLIAQKLSQYCLLLLPLLPLMATTKTMNDDR